MATSREPTASPPQLHPHNLTSAAPPLTPLTPWQARALRRVELRTRTPSARLQCRRRPRCRHCFVPPATSRRRHRTCPAVRRCAGDCHHWKRPLTLPCPTGTYAEHRDARVDLREKPRAIPIEKNRNGHPVAWLGGGNEEHGGKGRCKLCCIRLHRAGQPTAGATHSRTACTECEVILCKYCWHQWCHEDGGHAPQHIDAPPDPEWHGPPSITTPKRQRASSEQREDRTKRRRPPSPDAPPVRPRQAARAPSRLQESRKEKAEKKKQKKAQTAKARGANPCNKQAKKKRRKR